jgi:uncharacterized protein (TIGR02678 family)
VLLSRLVGDVRAAAAEAGVGASDTLPDRRALASALRHLIALGVVSETEGSVGSLTGADGEALITVDTDLLGHLPSGPFAEADSPEELISLAARPGARGVEHTVRRKLVETPVVLHADLDRAESGWLRARQRRESLVLDRVFGLATEIRLEGVAVTDPEEYLTDLAFPGTGTTARITLLALPELLADSEPDTAGRHPVPRERLRAVCGHLVADFPAAWSRQATDNLDLLVEDVLDLLRRLGLRGPAHRWAPRPDAVPGPAPTPEPVIEATLSLFETDLPDPLRPEDEPPVEEDHR